MRIQSCMRHLARRMLHAAWRSLRGCRMLRWVVEPERLVGAAEQRARFEQLAPPQQLLRFAVQQLRLQPQPCSVRRSRRGVQPTTRAARAPSRTHAVGAQQYRWDCACVHVCERMRALPCMHVRACLSARARTRMHARA